MPKATVNNITPTRRSWIASMAAVGIGGVTAAATAAAIADPVLDLIRNEDAIRLVACKFRSRADDILFAMPDEEYDRTCHLDEEKLRAPIGPLYAQANRAEERAGILFDRIARTKPTTIQGAIAQLELSGNNDDPLVKMAIAGLRDIARMSGKVDCISIRI